ncbi:MAG: SMI1/KNR4 family protein [Microbacteriaceae bacterium]
MSHTMRTVLKSMARLAAAQAELAVLRRDETFAPKLFPPATKGELKTLASRVGAPLPRSYRAFLSVSNGWDSFNGSARLLSTSDRDQDWFTSRLKQIQEHLAEFDRPPIPPSALIVMLGLEEPDFAFIDLYDPATGDERAVTHLDLIEGTLGHYPSFLAYLNAERKTIRDLIHDALGD